MKIASIPKNESERIKALNDYDVLDTDAEKVFDDITKLASQICNTPITLISLVDSERQWFKSRVGLDALETSRDIAFCSHAIHENKIFEVEDTLNDTRFSDNPLTTSDPKIRFYAGTPLLTPSGYAIGTLCVIDRQPNKLSEFQREALETLGRTVISQMELRKKNKQLMQANEYKTDFLSNMSHELRTPLNAIIGFNQLMLENAENFNIGTQHKEYLHHIDTSGKRLLSVVNSVLDISKIEAGKMSVSKAPTDVRLMMSDLKGILSVLANEKNVDLDIKVTEKVPEFLQLDEEKFYQILMNLINNAIKFTPSEHWVKAEINYKNDCVIVTVADQGIGIDKKNQEKLFSKFHQIKNNSDAKGSGLGLSITKGLVDLMGGKISLLSDLGRGSIFKVTLPAEAIEGLPSEITSSNKRSLTFNTNARILLVEDNELNQVVMEAILNSLGTKSHIVSSAEGAISILEEQVFDLVLMDIQLPNMSGLEAARILKKSYPELIIVAVSADAFHHYGDNLRDSIWDEYLTKPLKKDKLLDVLVKFLPSNGL
ncbi:ATP-binding protein [Glaciecola sp. MF2-115]|uniref:GAF domain-containing hybrid sensor histidine kinase/response regulator n=1 Tax=Glaciecola sp. MF2-115 TaxID=3384827 RepID=UPI0039A36B92